MIRTMVTVDGKQYCAETLVFEVNRLRNEVIAQSKLMETVYNERLKADMVAMLSEIQLEIEEMDSGCGWEGYRPTAQVIGLIKQKINTLKGENETC